MSKIMTRRKSYLTCSSKQDMDNFYWKCLRLFLIYDNGSARSRTTKTHLAIGPWILYYPPGIGNGSLALNSVIEIPTDTARP